MSSTGFASAPSSTFSIFTSEPCIGRPSTSPTARFASVSRQCCWMACCCGGRRTEIASRTSLPDWISRFWDCLQGDVIGDGGLVWTKSGTVWIDDDVVAGKGEYPLVVVVGRAESHGPGKWRSVAHSNRISRHDGPAGHRVRNSRSVRPYRDHGLWR